MLAPQHFSLLTQRQASPKSRRHWQPLFSQLSPNIPPPRQSWPLPGDPPWLCSPKCPALKGHQARGSGPAHWNARQDAKEARRGAPKAPHEGGQQKRPGQRRQGRGPWPAEERGPRTHSMPHSPGTGRMAATEERGRGSLPGRRKGKRRPAMFFFWGGYWKGKQNTNAAVTHAT